MKWNTCEYCGLAFTKVGLALHVGTERCRKLSLAKPDRQRAEALAQELIAGGKTRMAASTAGALSARGLDVLCGLEIAPTVVHDHDGYRKHTVGEEYWVYTWCYQAYKHFKERGQAPEFFKMLADLHAEYPDSPEVVRGIIMLQGVSIV